MSLWGRLREALRGPADADEHATPIGDPIQIAQVEAIIESMRPLLVADGGDIRVVSVEDGWVLIRLHGACRTCAASPLTVRGALEPKLREAHTWVQGVRVA